jgi:hypothetical protein
VVSGKNAAKTIKSGKDTAMDKIARLSGEKTGMRLTDEAKI